MEFEKGVTALSALGQETRLAVFKLLVEQSPKGLPAGVIAKQLSLNSSTLTGHLKILSHAELLFSTRKEQQIIYQVDIGKVRSLLNFLTQNCFKGSVNINFLGDLENDPITGSPHD